MRIQRLEIERWGHFSDLALDLSPPAGGLCLLAGENEAGKTTLREGLRALLFGIPESSPFSFRFPPPTLALRGRLVLADGQELDVRRRRGRGNTLTGKFVGTGQELDDAALRARLRHPSEDLFVNVFGFSQEELAQGGEVLRQGSLRTALASATVGAGVNPHVLIEELAGAASALFKSGGRTPPINKRAADIRDLALLLRRALLRGEDYQGLVDERGAAELRATELAGALDNLRRRAAIVDHLLQAIPERDELRAHREERRHLVIPAGLPAAAGEEHARLLSEREALLPAERELSAKIEKLSAQLGTIIADPRLLDHQTSIDDLYLRSGAIAKACKDSEKHVVAVAEQRPALEARVMDARPGWTLEDLSQFRLGRQRKLAFQQAVSRHAQLEEEAARARLDLAQLATSLDIDRRAQAELPGAIETAELEAVLDGWSGYRARADALAKQEAERARLERRLAALRRKLDPPWRGSELTPLPVPPEEDIAAAARRAAEIEQHTEREAQRREEREQEIERQRSELLLVEARGPVPSEDELHRLRALRDDGWALVRQTLAGEDVAAALAAWTPADNLLPAYEAAVQAADRYADELRAQMDAVVRRDECLRAVTRHTGELDQIRQRVEDLSAQAEAARLAWLGLWERCGFAPHTPAAMARWLQDYRALGDLAAQRDDAAAQCAQLSQAQSAYEQRLAAAVPGVAAEPDANYSEARQRLDDEKQRRAAEASLKARIMEAEDSQTRAADRLKTAEDALMAWHGGWEQLLRSLGLSDALEPAVAQHVLQDIELLQQEHKAWRERSQRVEHIERDRRSFEAEVVRICQQVGCEGDEGRSAERTVKEIHRRLEAAVDANRKQDDLAERLTEARDELDRRRERLAACDQALSALRARAEAVDDETFRLVADNVRRARDIDEAIVNCGRLIAQLRGAISAEEFDAQLDGAEALVLEAERKELEQQIATRDQEQRAAARDEAVAAEKLKAMDQTSAAAALQAAIESNRAALREEIGAYVKLTLERVLLERQVKAFQEQHQPGLLAELSRLFSAITAGRYPRVFQPLGSDTLRIADTQGGEKAPEQLSKGTREQLYLALRLAYVLQYCRSGEPLPIVLDDVLVHFDPRRAAQALRAMFALGKEFQVLFLTCHAHLVELARTIEPEVHVITLPAALA